MRQQIGDYLAGTYPLFGLSSRRCFHPSLGGREFRRRPTDEPHHQAVGSVPVGDPGQQSVSRSDHAIGRGRHIAVHKGIYEALVIEQRKLGLRSA
ncbi:hypothetical protein [Streptomyces sp. TE33382]